MAQRKQSNGFENTRSAVVDIGSNSVRLVIYSGPRRSPIAICNEKALCGLGRDMRPDGSFNPEAVETAIATLARFRRILNEHGNPRTRVIATAAVRDAKDGDAFTAAVRKLGFDPVVISGAEEAELAAYGVISLEPAVSGLIGDMGGGSLELVSLKDGEIEHAASLSIGPLTIMNRIGDDIDRAIDHINSELDSVDWLKDKSAKTLFSVGGAWRAVARIHMRLRKYPLAVLHRYEMTRSDIFDICGLIARQSRQSLEEIPGIPRRRLDTLPIASLVLRTVIERAGIERAIVSSGGVREGILYRDLKKEERAVDPLIATARFYAQQLSPDPGFGEAAFSVLDPLFADDSKQQRRLRYATAVMTDIGAFSHPDHRARHAFDTALRASLVGLSHEDRVAIALALFRRHNGRMEELQDAHVVGLLSWDDQQRAQRIGAALRFIASFSPRVKTPLAGCSLHLENGSLILRAPADHAVLMGETPSKRFNALASAFDAVPVTEFSD